MRIVKRTDEEIDEVLNAAEEQESVGGSKWPGMTYEQGVSAALNWVFGNIDDSPMSDE